MPEVISKNLQVVLRLDSHIIATANAGQIQQVLLNLINNAIQALVNSQKNDKKLAH